MPHNKNSVEDILSAKRSVSWTIPFEKPGVGWSLVISRHELVGRQDTVTIALHYGDKVRPTHAIEGTAEEFHDMFNELFGEDEGDPSELFEHLENPDQEEQDRGD